VVVDGGKGGGSRGHGRSVAVGGEGGGEGGCECGGQGGCKGSGRGVLMFDYLLISLHFSQILYHSY
jgi:hypothetical protein